jgi:signal transduction histidine kinase
LSATKLVAQFIDDHQYLATSRRQRIVLASGDTDAPILGDRDRLIQVLVNLTQNACDAAPSDAQITWTVGHDPGLGSVTLEVRNPGEPIPPELLTRLTEPFFSTKPSGTGLGLAIVRRLTLVHGGELSFNSSQTGVTCARIVLPRLVSNASGSDDAFPPRDADL